MNIRKLQAILNKSQKQHPTKQQLHGHLPPVSKTIQMRRTRYAGHCVEKQRQTHERRSPWTLSRGRACVGRPTRTYLQQLCTDWGYSRENYWKRLKIGTNRERESGKSMLAARHDDDDDDVDDIYIYSERERERNSQKE